MSLFCVDDKNCESAHVPFDCQKSLEAQSVFQFNHVRPRDLHICFQFEPHSRLTFLPNLYFTWPKLFILFLKYFCMLLFNIFNVHAGYFSSFGK